MNCYHSNTTVLVHPRAQPVREGFMIRGPFFEGPKMFSRLGKLQQNFKTYYRAVLFTYS